MAPNPSSFQYPVRVRIHELLFLEADQAECDVILKAKNGAPLLDKTKLNNWLNNINKGPSIRNLFKWKTDLENETKAVRDALAESRPLVNELWKVRYAALKTGPDCPRELDHSDNSSGVPEEEWLKLMGKRNTIVDDISYKCKHTIYPFSRDLEDLYTKSAEWELSKIDVERALTEARKREESLEANSVGAGFARISRRKANIYALM